MTVNWILAWTYIVQQLLLLQRNTENMMSELVSLEVGQNDYLRKKHVHGCSLSIRFYFLICCICFLMICFCFFNDLFIYVFWFVYDLFDFIFDLFWKKESYWNNHASKKWFQYGFTLNSSIIICYVDAIYIRFFKRLLLISTCNYI